VRAAKRMSSDQELGAAAARDPRDRPDRHLGHAAQPLEQREKRSDLGERLGLALGQGQDPVDVGVRDEEVRVGALEDDHLHVGILLEQRHQPPEIEEQRQVEQIDRRMIDRHPGHPLRHPHPKPLQTFIARHDVPPPTT